MKAKKMLAEEGRPLVPKIYLLKITLVGIEPPIWRRIAVKSDVTLEKLHYIIQVVMGWENYHLHEFIIKKQRYGEVADEFDWGPPVISDKNTILQDVITRARSKNNKLARFK